jgi:osmoprotectant transport system substrate-binding protein
MHLRRPALAGLVAVVIAGVAGCGQNGPSEPGSTSQAACDPIAGEELVVLADDKNLQTVDNVIPAINADAVQPEMIEALNAVSASLDTPTLIDLNRQVDIERNTSSQVAAAYLEEANLDLPSGSGGGRVVVGAANFSESATLAEIYAGALREAGYDASVRTIGNRETYLPALVSGELTVIPEYVGTLTEFLNKRQNGADAEPMASVDLEETADALTTLGEREGLVFGEPSQAADENAFAVTAAFAQEHDVETLSELAEACGGGIVLGGPPECPERPFCQLGLEETYGLEIAEFTSLDAGGPLTKTALRQGRIAVGLVLSSDAALATPEG